MVMDVPCAAQTVRAAARRLTRRYEEALRPTGLTASQYTLLTALTASGGMGQGGIGAALAFEQTTVTRLVAAMARRGWVRLEPEPGDARRRIVRATEAGLRLHAAARPLWQRAQDETLSRLDDGEWEAMRSLLRRLGE